MNYARTASLHRNGEKLAVLVEVGVRDERRLQVLLAETLTAMASLERDVESMSDEAVAIYLEQRAGQLLTIPQNP
jgi:hypothetical protein